MVELYQSLGKYYTQPTDTGAWLGTYMQRLYSRNSLKQLHCYGHFVSRALVAAAKSVLPLAPSKMDVDLFANTIPSSYTPWVTHGMVKGSYSDVTVFFERSQSFRGRFCRVINMSSVTSNSSMRSAYRATIGLRRGFKSFRYTVFMCDGFVLTVASILVFV